MSRDRLALMRRSEAADAPTYMLLAHEREWVLRVVEAADELAKALDTEDDGKVLAAVEKYRAVRGTQEGQDG